MAPDGLVLLVDDEAMVRGVTRLMLERAGFVVMEAHSPEKALEIVHQQAHSIRLLISDVQMLVMNGFELAGKIAQHHPNLPMFFISGDVGETIRKPADCLLLEKPFTRDSLLQTVHHVLHGSYQQG